MRTHFSLIITVALLSLAIGTDLETLLLLCPETNNTNVKIPNPHDCSSYFICINDFPIAIFCPEGLQYDPVSSSCTFPDIANCKLNATQPPLIEGPPPPQVNYEPAGNDQESETVFPPFKEPVTQPPLIKEPTPEPQPLEEYTTLPPVINKEPLPEQPPVEELTTLPPLANKEPESQQSEEYTTLSPEKPSSENKESTPESLPPKEVETLPPSGTYDTILTTESPKEEPTTIPPSNNEEQNPPTSNDLPPEIGVKIQTDSEDDYDESVLEPSNPQSTFDNPTFEPINPQPPHSGDPIKPNPPSDNDDFLDSPISVDKQEQHGEYQPIYPFPPPIDKPNPPIDCTNSECLPSSQIEITHPQEPSPPSKPPSSEQQQQPQYPVQPTTEKPKEIPQNPWHPIHPTPPPSQQPQQPPNGQHQPGQPDQRPQYPPQGEYNPGQKPQIPPNPWKPSPPPPSGPHIPWQPQYPPSNGQQYPWQPQYPPNGPYIPGQRPPHNGHFDTPQNPPLGPSYQPSQQITQWLSKQCPKHNFVQVYFASPTDCNSFYQCNWGVPELHRCPDDLHFNAQLNVCDWPEKAKCHLLVHH